MPEEDIGKRIIVDFVFGDIGYRVMEDVKFKQTYYSPWIFLFSLELGSLWVNFEW